MVIFNKTNTNADNDKKVNTKNIEYVQLKSHKNKCKLEKWTDVLNIRDVNLSVSTFFDILDNLINSSKSDKIVHYTNKKVKLKNWITSGLL